MSDDPGYYPWKKSCPSTGRHPGPAGRARERRPRMPAGEMAVAAGRELERLLAPRGVLAEVTRADFAASTRGRASTRREPRSVEIFPAGRQPGPVRRDRGQAVCDRDQRPVFQRRLSPGRRPGRRRLPGRRPGGARSPRTFSPRPWMTSRESCVTAPVIAAGTSAGRQALRRAWIPNRRDHPQRQFPDGPAEIRFRSDRRRPSGHSSVRHRFPFLRRPARARNAGDGSHRFCPHPEEGELTWIFSQRIAEELDKGQTDAVAELTARGHRPGLARGDHPERRPDRRHGRGGRKIPHPPDLPAPRAAGGPGHARRAWTS